VIRHRGDRLFACTQNFVEFWNVATRPATRNGFGLTPAEADRRLSILEHLFYLLPDSPDVYSEWRRLVVSFGVSGVQVHDARLVVAMKANNLTLNSSDFHRYVVDDIIAVEPVNV